MIAWRKSFPWHRKPLGYLRLLRARHRYFDTLGIQWRPRPKLIVRKGYRHRMWNWRDQYAGQRCFIVGNGPSLKQMDMAPLRHEITIGANGIYKQFGEWGWHTTYLLMEDLEQTELRAPDLPRVKGPIKVVGLNNAYCVKPDTDTYFANIRYGNPQYWDKMAPRFSEDFADIVYLGSTVTYFAIQLAYYLGCDPVYLIGVDHNYGKLPELFPPGKIEVTAENYELVRQCHFDKNYYKIGDVLGVPHIGKQETAFAKARKVFEARGRRIYNAGINSRLDVFERIDYDGLFR